MQPTTIRDQEIADIQQQFLQKVYSWMFGALAITGGIAYVLAGKPQILAMISGSPILFYGTIFGQLGLVWYLSARIDQMTSSRAFGLFTLYAALNGVVFSLIFAMYTSASIVSTFLVTAGTFAVMSFYGFVTKQDLSKLGNLLFMALIGLIIASVVNYFFASSTLYWIITYAGILIFVGLIAYDTQKIKKMSVTFHDAEGHNKGAIIGALMLYLDFVNLFLYLLRLLGNRK